MAKDTTISFFICQKYTLFLNHHPFCASKKHKFQLFMKRILLFTVAVITALTIQAQHKITGKVVDKQSGETLPGVTVKLLKTDSTMVKGVLTDEDGHFDVTTEDGRYIVQLTSVGYESYTKRVTVSGKDNAMGTISLKADAIMLDEAVVTAQAAKVTLRKDTFVYNANAFRTPEGSTIEELVKRLPGAQIDDQGKITINGKEVKKIKLDGKEFMTGDTQTALKNLPTDIVNQIKAYDEKSDLTRISGIEDGNEETVLDFGVKPGMNRGLMGNADLAAGTKDRYAGRIMGGKFDEKMTAIVMLNANNTNDMGFPGGGGGFRGGMGRQGLTANKMAGVNINYEPNQNFKWDGSIRWNHSDGDALSRQSTQNFYSRGNSYSNSLNQNYSRGNRWNGQMRIEWQIDPLTNILFRPTFSYNGNDQLSSGTSASFKSDPYQYVDDPLGVGSIARMLAISDTIVVNSGLNSSINYTTSTSLNGTLQLNRRLSSLGRNVTLVLGGSYGENKGNQFQTDLSHFYQLKDALGNDSILRTNRYNLTPTKNWNYNARLTYSEPLLPRTYLQFSYEFQYRYQKSDRSTYDFAGYDFDDITAGYRGWDNYLMRLTNPLEDYRSESLSRFSEYKNYIHTAEVMLRIVRDSYNFNIGVQMIPQTSKFVQRYLGVETDTTRTVFNITPTADFRWKISDVSQLRINYRGQTGQPSMSDLLDITDDSNPMNITKGNPGLKPSFTNNFRLQYNNYFTSHQQSVMANLNFRMTSNSISNKVSYDDNTGVRTTRPENINGNWSTQGFLVYNASIDSAGYFNINTFTNLSYENKVGFVDMKTYNTNGTLKSTSKTFGLSERIGLSYRDQWIEIEPNGSFNYNRSRNSVKKDADLDTWTFSYGLSANVTMPWGTRLASDISMNSRRGFSDASLNTNELIWNAQISQSFLRGNALTVSLQFYDILNRQSNLTRTINEMMRSDTEYNSIHQYAMLHVIYRLNIFGGRQGGRGRGGFGGFGGGMPMPPGGFGGGRPGGGGGFGGGRPRF